MAGRGGQGREVQASAPNRGKHPNHSIWRRKLCARVYVSAKQDFHTRTNDVFTDQTSTFQTAPARSRRLESSCSREQLQDERPVIFQRLGGGSGVFGDRFRSSSRCKNGPDSLRGRKRRLREKGRRWRKFRITADCSVSMVSPEPWQRARL